MDEVDDEQKRLDEARRAGGLPIGRPTVAPPPVAAPKSSIGFTKPFTLEEKQKQSAAFQVFLRNRK
jgi:hypothetical protein